MDRMQLFEFEDQQWLPSAIRDGQTDFFSFMAYKSSLPYRDFAKKLAAAMHRVRESSIVELGSGGGGHAVAIGRQLRNLGTANLRLILTDLFPNISGLKRAKANADFDVEVIEKPVDATEVPGELKGFRLICNAFHHLPENIAGRCLEDAVKKEQGIAILEFVGRSPGGFVQLFFGLVTMMLIMPLVRPFRASRLFYTYLLPLIPLTTLWDGIASCMRVYSPQELRALVGKLPPNHYDWDIGTINVSMTPIQVTYLIAVPTKRP